MFHKTTTTTMATETALTDATLGTLSCYDVYYGSYISGTIANDACSLVQETLAATPSPCCKTLTGYTPCLVCGEKAGIAFPDATVTSIDGSSVVTCSWLGSYGLTGYLNEAECQYLTPLAIGPCCAPTPSPTLSPVAPESPPVAPSSSSSSPMNNPSMSNDTLPPVVVVDDSSSEASLRGSRPSLWWHAAASHAVTLSLAGILLFLGGALQE